jgi:hypothetical protein
MPDTRAEIIEERRRLKAEYHELYDEIAALLFRHDPMGITCETTTDEYEPEVGTIPPRLRNCGTVEDVRRVVHEEFNHWFGLKSASGADYTAIAAEIWDFWQRSNHSKKSQI